MRLRILHPTQLEGFLSNAAKEQFEQNEIGGKIKIETMQKIAEATT
jgi:hypothetical protein